MSHGRTYKYYDFCMAAFVCILLCANLIGPAKATTITLPIIGPVTFLAGVLFFPISYFFGDIFTEVYGYGRDRRVVWAGFGALIFASFMAATVVALPPAAHWVDKQPAVVAIFGSTPRIIAGSISAFWCGSFVNSFVLAKLKILTKGRWLWTRTIGSTMCGEAVDSAIFYAVAFYGNIPDMELIALAITQYVLKVLWEVVSTPLTYRLVNWLKKVESEDYYDHTTNFTPFTLRT
jgi:uncharacterized integral membrane protein (TIGR00697 family)